MLLVVAITAYQFEDDANNIYLGSTIPATNGGDNIAIGRQSLDALNNAGATDNLAIGPFAGTALENGNGNMFVGHSAGFFATGGNRNTFFGVEIGGALTSGGNNNTGVGYDCLDSLAGTSSENVAVGHETLFALGTGTGNTAIGSDSGKNLTSGDDNLFLGVATNAPSASVSFYMNLANTIYADTGTPRVVIGGSGAKPTGDIQLTLSASDKVMKLNTISTATEGTLTIPDGSIWYNSTLDKYRGKRKRNNCDIYNIIEVRNDCIFSSKEHRYNNKHQYSVSNSNSDFWRC